MQRCLIAIALFVCLLSAAAQARAENRLALVIGNAGYRSLQLARLSTPHNDMRLIGDVLTSRLKYTVLGGKDLTLEEMRLRIDDFVRRVREAGRHTTAIVFYSGHGMEVNEENFLFPIDAMGPFTAGNIRQKAVSLTGLLNELVGAGAAVSVVILDACRNDGTKGGASKGFVPVFNPPGTIVAYATAPGQLAVDDSSHPTGASPYSRVLAEVIAAQNLSALEVLSKVRNEVYRITKGEQTPWERIELQGRPFAFNPEIPLIRGPEPAVPPWQIACERRQGAHEVVNVPGWDHLNIRSNPRQASANEPSNVVAKIPSGAKGVDVEGCRPDGWCKVRYLCATGYASAQYLRALAGPAPADPPHLVASVKYIGVFRVSNVRADDALNVRESPLDTAPIMHKLPFNAQNVNVHYCGQPPRSRESWCFVSHDSRQGWVNGAFLRNARTGTPPPHQGALN
jgi:hypothetical protein